MLEFLNQNAPVKFVVAFAIVLALIALTAWLVRRFGSNRLNGSTRGRQPRLAVIDAASVDGRRRLVLIRRDNVEHLVMIGGPTDVVIEPNIVRAAAAAREAARNTGEPTLRSASFNDNGNGNWPLQPAAEPPPAAPVQPRAARAPVTDEPWVPSEPPPREPAAREPSRPRAPVGPISGLAAEFKAKVSPDLDIPPPPRAAPAREPAAFAPPPASPPPSAPAQTDQNNLAEMAQRLEAALRRPPMPETRAPVTDPLAAAPPPPPLSAPRAEPRFESKFEPKPEPRLEPRAEPRPDFKIEPKSDMKADAKPEAKPAKNPFDSLEEEMASLLGRSGKS
jgi:hypothetical protein